MKRVTRSSRRGKTTTTFQWETHHPDLETRHPADEDRGFVVQTKRGAFSLKARHATEWRLTEFGDDVTDALATKDFARWEKQNTVSPMKPSGFTRSTVRAL